MHGSMAVSERPTGEPSSIDRLLLVSNRGPVSYDVLRDGRLRPTRGSGGVVTALESLGGERPATWISCAMSEGDRRAAETPELAGSVIDQSLTQRFVLLSREVYRKHYELFSNRVLWFLQHYLWNAPYEPKIDNRLWDAWEHGYVVANQRFADAVLAEIDRTSTRPAVMIQDYHLYLAASYIRAQAPEALLQHFTHIPWPEARYWQLLPPQMRQAICEGLVANDIVGFQTQRDVANFMSVIRDNLAGAECDAASGRILYRGRSILVRAYPISVDPRRLRRQAQSAEARRLAAQLAAPAGQQTIVRVDRVDPSKNLLRGFEAFDLLLKRRPELRGRVRFLAFLVPSREQVPAYRRYREQVFSTVERMNRRHGRAGWQPIRIFHENHYLQALAGMTQYDVLLVNPILDGMNLVAKEGPIVNEREGVLVLSEGAGAHHQLGGWALSVAPADVRGTAEALERALTMPRPEREARATALRMAVEREDVHQWLRAQLDDLELVARQPTRNRRTRAMAVLSTPRTDRQGTVDGAEIPSRQPQALEMES